MYQINSSWRDKNKEAKSLLNVNDTRTQVNVYMGMQHALFEAVFGVKAFYPHKKSILIVRDSLHCLADVTQLLQRESYQLHYTRWSELNDNYNEWFKQLPTDLLCVIYAADHPFTAEIYPKHYSLVKFLTEKKVLMIELNHFENWLKKSSLQTFMFRLTSLNRDLAVGLQGARFKTIPHSAELMCWDHINIKPTILNHQQRVENKELILAFENNPKYISYFKNDFESRVFDRAIVRVDGVSGDYFCHQLIESINQKDSFVWQDCGLDIDLETTNLCRWQKFALDFHKQESEDLVLGNQDWVSLSVAFIEKFKRFLE